MKDRRVEAAVGRLVRGVARGLSLFAGAFLFLNAAAGVLGSGRSHGIWLIEIHWLPSVLGSALLACASVALLGYGVRPEMSAWRLRATCAAAALIAVGALTDAVSFYAAWRGGSIEPGTALPLSAVVAAMAVVVLYAVARRGSVSGGARRERLVVALTVVALMAAFPLAQVTFFGKTDYAREADVAVVLGARVMPSGVLSWSLEDRVHTGVELYRAGLVERIIMSGGVDASGTDEAAAMKARAVELGVPEDRVLTDSAGVNTDATVANTCAMITPGERVLVVSHFYHLPRIKLAYHAAGRQVYTVPATERRIIAKTPYFVAREIPGFWVYWLRALGRDVLGA